MSSRRADGIGKPSSCEPCIVFARYDGMLSPQRRVHAYHTLLAKARTEGISEILLTAKEQGRDVKRKLSAALLAAVGLIIIGLTVWFVVVGIKHPTAGRSIAIALFSALGAPLGLACVGTAYRQFRGPNSIELRAEADAKRRAAAALEDAETAEQIKAELEAYVTVRAWELEIKRKRLELAATADQLVTMLQDLNADEDLLGEAKTKLSPVTIETLSVVLDDKARVKIPPLVTGLLDGAIPLGLGGIGVPAAEALANDILKRLERRRLKRIRSAVPQALSDADGSGAGE
jgi:hypothetical protein